MIEKDFTVNDIGSLHYVECPGDGPALVLIPGFTESWVTYAPFFDALAKISHVYAYSMRGHGGSMRTSGAYTLLNHAQDAQRFLSTVVRRPAIVAGHSLGGVVAAYVAAQVPTLISQLVLEDTYFAALGERNEEFVSWKDGFLQLQGHPLNEWEEKVALWMFDETRTRQEMFGEAGVRRQVQQWMQPNIRQQFDRFWRPSASRAIQNRYMYATLNIMK